MNKQSFKQLKNLIEHLPKSKILAGESVSNGRYRFYLSGKKLGRINVAISNQDAIIMGDGGVANIAFAKGKYSYSSHNFGFFSNSKHINTKYIYRAIEQFLPVIDYMGFVGSGLKNIDKSFLFNLYIQIPSLPEQKKISSILNSVDEVIEKTQSQINKLQDLKKGMINKLLTKGIGHIEFKDSELGRIPKSWKITELSKVSKILSSNVDKKTIKNETPVLLCNYMDVYNNLKITREINFMKASAKKNEMNKFLIEKDDVIITKDSETPDDIAISSYVTEDFDNVLCGYHLSIIRSNKSVLDGKFLSLFFKLDYTRNRFSVLANGTTRFGLNLKEIENSKILLPSLEEQKNIANIIFSLDDTISTITKKFNKYIFLKTSLMQDLLVGKVRVSVN